MSHNDKNDDLADITALEALSDSDLADLGITRRELVLLRQALTPAYIPQPFTLVSAWHESGEEDLSKLPPEEFTRIIDRLFT